MLIKIQRRSKSIHIIMNEAFGICGIHPIFLSKNQNESINIIDKYGACSLNMFGDTALHYVGKKETVRLLINNGADVNAKNRRGMTPLHYVINEDVALELILYGADVNLTSDTGLTPLHMSMGMNISKVLIKYGSNVNAKDDSGETPLHTCPNTETLDLLVENGASIDSIDSTNSTPLLSHCYSTSAGIYGTDRNVKRLIELGASVHVKNNMGLGIEDIMGDKYSFIEKVQCERNRRELVVLRSLYKKKFHEFDDENICNRLITHASDDIFRRIVGFI